MQFDPAGRETPDAPAHASESTLRALRPTERRTLPHDVADQLLDLIASSSGSEITVPAERALCEQLSVSRNVLREALAALHQAGVIETRGKLRIAHVGQARARRVARLPRPSDPVLNPMEVGRILEPEVASLVAKRASAEAIREMGRYVTLMEEAAARGDSLVDHDSAFHVAIAGATGNETLVALVRALNDALRESRELSFGPESAPRHAIADHVAILSAIRIRWARPRRCDITSTVSRCSSARPSGQRLRAPQAGRAWSSETIATVERERNRMTARIESLTVNRDAIAEYLEAVRPRRRLRPG